MRSPLNFLTVDEYLLAEESSPIRHEYLGGQIFTMAGASEEHNLIVGNILTLPEKPPSKRGSVLELIEQIRSKRPFRTAEDIDRQLQEERES